MDDLARTPDVNVQSFLAKDERRATPQRSNAQDCYLRASRPLLGA